MKKLLLTALSFTGLTFFAWLLSLSSCRQQKYNAILKDIQLKTYRLQPLFDSGADTFKVTEGESVPADSFMIRYEITAYTYLVQKQMPAMGNAAYAFKFASPLYNHIDKIKEIKVFTLNDYNATYAAGSDITPICRFHLRDMRTTANPEPLEEILKEIYTDEYWSYSQEAFSIGLSFADRPAVDNAPQRFRTEIYTDKGGIFLDTTVSFRIKL